MEEDEEQQASGWFVSGAGQAKGGGATANTSDRNSDDESDRWEEERDGGEAPVVWVTADLLHDIRAGLSEAGDSPYKQIFKLQEGGNDVYLGKSLVRKSTGQPNTFDHESFMQFLETGLGFSSRAAGEAEPAPATAGAGAGAGAASGPAGDAAAVAAATM